MELVASANDDEQEVYFVPRAHATIVQHSDETPVNSAAAPFSYFSFKVLIV